MLPCWNLDLHLASLYVFQVVHDEPANVCAYTDSAPIFTERYCCHNFILLKAHLLVSLGTMRIVIIYVDNFDFFALNYIVEVNPSIDSTRA